MPFVQQLPRAFTVQDVQSLSPNQNGVYGLFRQGVWIYIGKGDIRQRLLDHLGGDNPRISHEWPTNWVGEVIVGDPTNREKQLIEELRPVCNQRVG